jgi:6-aminohexanoate-oligomer endohydrolase
MASVTAVTVVRSSAIRRERCSTRPAAARKRYRLRSIWSTFVAVVAVASCAWVNRSRALGPTKIAVFTVLNAVGAIVDRRGKVVRGYLDPATGTRHHLMEDIEQRFADGTGAAPPLQNTTLTVLVTNQQLAPNLLTQIARQVHDSMCRGIQPFHTTYDGDVLYAITTDEVQNPALDDVALGTVASEVAWDAILSSVQGP